MIHRARRLGAVVLVTAFVGLVGVGTAGIATAKQKRLRLTCYQTTEAISNTAQQLRAKYNALGFTIEDAPYGILVGEGCENVGKLSRKGSAFMADVHHADDGSPPFPGETNPYVYAYHWQWNELVSRTKKGGIRTSLTDFRCVREAREPPDYAVQVLPC
jgi:hypothetical protein